MTTPTTPVLPSLPEPAMRAAPVGQEAWPFPRVGYYTAEQMNEHARRAIESLSRAPAEPVNSAGETPEQHAHRWATELAVSMARKFYPEAPQFEPMSDLLGVITQIDNMTTGLVRAPAEPAETEAWLIRMSDGTRFIHSHNAIADYRSLDPAAKVVELVPRGSGAHPTESAGPAPAEIVRPNEWETVLAAQRLYAPMVAAVIDLLADVDERHDTETGFKRYSVPYGAVNNLRAVVGAVPSAPSTALGESHEG